MTKKNVLLGTGAIALSLASVLAGRASAKFNQAPNLYYTDGGSGSTHCKSIRTSVTTADFTTGGSGVQAAIKTQASGTTRLVFATSTCAVAVHFRPL